MLDVMRIYPTENRDTRTWRAAAQDGRWLIEAGY
jgi:hypothetical protein